MNQNNLEYIWSQDEFQDLMHQMKVNVKVIRSLEQRIIDLERTIEHLTQYPMMNTNDGWYYNNP